MSKNKETPSGATSGERRADNRLLTNARVEIAGLDGAGSPFTEQTNVEDFSDVGCRFRTQMSLRRGDTVAIKPLSPDDESLPHEHSKLFEIMWIVRRSTGWTVGARTCQTKKNANLEPASADDSPRIP